MSGSDFESAIRVLQKASTSRGLLNALISIRKNVDWPKHRDNVAVIRSRGCLKQLTNTLAVSTHKGCIDTALSILGNCLMERACTSEVVAQHNILSVLNQLLKKYPKDDSVNGRMLRILGNMCQHRDQWANIIIDRKPLLVVNAVDIVKRASQDELPEGEKITEATILSALRVLRELLNCHTLMTLVKQFEALKAIGSLFIKYSNSWQTDKHHEKLLLEIVRVIHEYSRYRYYHSILAMRNTERGDSLVHLTTVLILCPKRVVKIVMNFIRSCRLKSELPIPEICTKFIEVLETHSLVKEFHNHYSEYLHCLCYLLDHPVNRSAERCGKAIPLLIKVLKEFQEPSNNIAECCMLLIHTLNKFKYDPKLLIDQLKHGIIPVLVDKLAWIVGPPDALNLKHVSEKKRKYMFGPASPVFIKRKQLQSDFTLECSVRSAASSSDEDLDLLNESLNSRLGNRSPSSCSSCSDVDSIGVLSWSEASCSSSPSQCAVHESDSDNYSPVCSETEEASQEDGITLDNNDLCDPMPSVPDLDDSFENDEDDLDDAKSLNDDCHTAISEPLKAGLRMDILKLIKTFIKMRPVVPQLANADLLVQLTKCAVLDRCDLKNVVCELLNQHEYLIPLLKSDFIHTLCYMREIPSNHDYCVKCSLHLQVASSILKKISEVAESGAGKGEIAHILLRGDLASKQLLVMVIPYIIRNRNILSKLMLNCGGLEVLMNLLHDEDKTRNRRSLSALCQMATHRLLIANPKDLSTNLNRPKLVADRYKPPENSRDLVSFILDDGSVVEADRQYVSVRSEFFYSLLNGHFKECMENEVALSKVEARSFRCLLYLMGKVDLSEIVEIDLDLETLLDVIMLSDRYLLQELCMALTDSVEQYKISTKTVSTIYNWSIESRTNLLRVECVAFALVVSVDEKERLAMFQDLFNLGYVEQLVEDIKNLVVRYLTLGGHDPRMKELWRKRLQLREKMRERLLKNNV